MDELVKLGDKTYVLQRPVNIGFYLLNNQEVCLVDTGNGKDYGKIIEKILENCNWHLKCIINTHSHADHIGANKYLQDKYNIPVYSSNVESYFINNPLLEPTLLFGSNPLKELQNRFLMAKPSNCMDIANLNISGLSVVDLKGHSYGMIGILTSDNVLFAGDAYTDVSIIEKYAIQYLFDVQNYLDTLNYLLTTNYSYYVPAHGQIERDPKNTILENIRNVQNIEKRILNLVENTINYNELLTKIFSSYHIKINSVQYYLISATIKAYLTKLNNENKIVLNFTEDGIFISKVTENI